MSGEKKNQSNPESLLEEPKTINDDRTLRERLKFYESFDQVIQDNIAQSTTMLREAMELREQAAIELSRLQTDAAVRRGHDLQQQRSLLSALLDDVIQLQGQAERLARRVADALDDIESDLPTGPFRSLSTMMNTEPESIDGEPEQVDEPSIDNQPTAPLVIEPTESGISAALPSEDQSVSMVVLIHDVPRMATAQSLQRYLAGLEMVKSVAPREFNSGELRLQVNTVRPLTVADLQEWADGRKIESIHERADLIEVRLASDFGHPASHPG